MRETREVVLETVIKVIAISSHLFLVIVNYFLENMINYIYRHNLHPFMI